MWSIIVHGGAGAIDDTQGPRHRQGCEQAAAAGALVLGAGGTAMDAAIAAVRVLEDDPCFNAGIGSALDEDGLALTDAAVMRGRDLGYGAVGAVAGVRHPIDLARAILEDGRHCLLVGAGAVRFARQAGIELCDPHRLETDRSIARWWAASGEKRGPSAAPSPPAAGTGGNDGTDGTDGTDGNPPEPGTVGAVACDASGSVAAATSTGGLLGKRAGRIGDSPIAGAGTYARDAWGALSATGHGETMMRVVFAYQALLCLEARGSRPAEVVLREQLDRATGLAGGRGGAIVALPDGSVAHARNTAHMSVAWVLASGQRGSEF